MKLRNKKTGTIGVLEATTYYGGRPNNSVEVYEVGMGAVRVLAQYNTLDGLLEEWEDYRPAEPLIKDEKTRKVVLAWAEVNDIDPTTKLKFDEDDLRLSTGSSCIEFEVYQSFKELADGAEYTIAELCGPSDSEEEK